MTKLSLVLGVLLLSACGSGLSSGERQAEAQFEPFLNRFISEAAERGLETRGWETLTIVTESLPAGIQAQCQTGFGSRRIVVDPIAWEYNDTDAAKTSVLFHEMGHCLLDRRHNEVPGCVSVMNTQPLSGLAFERKEEQYLDELFTHHCGD